MLLGTVLVAGLGVVLVFQLRSGPAPASTLTPAPADPSAPQARLSWPDDVRTHYLSLQTKMGHPRPKVTAKRAMIAGVTDPFAVHAGLEVLKQGGNAVDAAVTTALAQSALNAGAAVSFAGMLTAVYYDAATGRVHALNAAFNTVKAEEDPLSIPKMGQPGGRTALVPGFMAGIEALHTRFGRQRFESLFEPAIWIADHGFPLSPAIEGWLKAKTQSATRLPEGKRIFLKPDGKPYRRGDLFRQPELATTLRKVASEGAGYMYRGEWARRCAALVQREGGRMSYDDLASYEVIWDEPARISYGKYEVTSLGAPNYGGAITLGALKIGEAAQVKKYGAITDSAEALYYQIQINRRAAYYGHSQTTPELLLKDDTSRQLWAEIQQKTKRPEVATGPGHSSSVIAVDEEGNVVALLHSNNTVIWGATGIFVDGVALPDPAAFQQHRIAAVGGGKRLPEGTNPVLVLENGKPVLASVTIGGGLHATAYQNLLRVLDFGLDPQTSVDQPTTAPFRSDPAKEAVERGQFSETAIAGARALGLPLEVVPKVVAPGYWLGVRIDRQSGELTGGVSNKLNGIVEGIDVSDAR